MGNMALLTYISDDDLFTAVEKLLNAGTKAKVKVAKNPYKNVVDPFSALIDAANQGIGFDEWMAKEKDRQVQKAFQNAIGDFHQEIIGFVPGWSNPGKGGSYDVINEGRRILAEIKNKHNTMNSTSAAGTYDKLAGWIDYGKADWTAYTVGIVPKSPNPTDMPFTPSVRKVRKAMRENLRIIDGRSFYALATGRAGAIDELYAVLPGVIAEVLDTSVDSSVYHEFNVLFEKAYIKK